MANNSLIVQDVAKILRGARKVCIAVVDVQANKANKQWENSSLKPMAANSMSSMKQMIVNASEADVSRFTKETTGRISVVINGLNAYIKRDTHETEIYNELTADAKINATPTNTKPLARDTNHTEYITYPVNMENISSMKFHTTAGHQTSSSIDFSKLTDSFQVNDHYNTSVTDNELNTISSKLSEIQAKIISQDVNTFENVADYETNTESEINHVEKSYLGKLDHDEPMGHKEQKNAIPEIKDRRVESESIKPENATPANKDIQAAFEGRQPENAAPAINDRQVSSEREPENTTPTIKDRHVASENKQPQGPVLIGRKPLSKKKAKSTLSANATPSKVPHSQLGRLMSFGRLGAGLVVGGVAEMARRSLGGTDDKATSLADSSPFLTEANAERIVYTLCKVRGVALKLGQMFSMTDSTFINPTLQKIFERVRQSADFMPTWQLQRTLESSLGGDWRSLVSTFDEKPFAAASIGQVHQATLHDGRAVAMKIQYPGVAHGIESDINNLVSTLKIANIFPEGLFVDEAIRVAKKELRLECDYQREKECTKKYRQLIQPYDDYYVPDVIEELCTDTVLTTELIEGVAVDKCIDMDQSTRDRICNLIMKLCLMEVFQFGFMQTDPNWSNFFYNEDTKQIALVDFGACRSYKKEFVDNYINVINGAAQKDRKKVLEYSRKLGFLTGHEAKIMEETHIDAVMILGEAFQSHEPFDFGGQLVTQRIHELVPVLLNHRMCPPPEETYSLHRKLSGVFLLCAKLGGQIQCKSYFDNIYNNYKFGKD